MDVLDFQNLMETSRRCESNDDAFGMLLSGTTDLSDYILDDKRAMRLMENMELRDSTVLQDYQNDNLIITPETVNVYNKKRTWTRVSYYNYQDYCTCDCKMKENNYDDNSSIVEFGFGGGDDANDNDNDNNDDENDSDAECDMTDDNNNANNDQDGNYQFLNGIYPIFRHNSQREYSMGKAKMIMDHQGLIWDNQAQRDDISNVRSSSLTSCSVTRLACAMGRSDCDVNFRDENNVYRQTNKMNTTNIKATNFFPTDPDVIYKKRMKLLNFSKFFPFAKPAICHFQIRGLVSCVNKNTIYYPSVQSTFDYDDFSIMKLNPMTGKSELVFQPSSEETMENNDYASLIGSKITTMSCNEESFIAAGTLEGMLILVNPLTKEYRYSKITSNRRDFLNSILISKHLNYSNELIIASNDSNVTKFDFHKEKVLGSKKPPIVINSMCESPINGGNEILIVGDSKEGIIIDRRMNLGDKAVSFSRAEAAAITDGHFDYSSCCAWSADNYLATGNQDGTVRIYDRRNLSKNSQSLMCLSGGGGAVRDVKFDNRGNYLAFSEFTDNVFVVDLQNGIFKDDLRVGREQMCDNLQMITKTRRKLLPYRYPGQWRNEPMGITSSFNKAENKRNNNNMNSLSIGSVENLQMVQDDCGSNVYRASTGSSRTKANVVNYQRINAFGRIAGLSFNDYEYQSHNSGVLTIGINDLHSGGILQYKLPSDNNRSVGLNNKWFF